MYLVETPETLQTVADLINRCPDRFRFGTDEVGPTDQAKYPKIRDVPDFPDFTGPGSTSTYSFSPSCGR
jgi:hypothetical protein